MKQGTLFSFFAKKEPTTKGNDPTKAKKAAAAKASASNPNSGAKTTTAAASVASTSKAAVSTVAKPRQAAAEDTKMRIGAKIEVYWDDDQKFYPAIVREQSRGRTRLEYLDDQTEEWVVLRNERWRAVADQQPKRRRIVPDDDESDEEMEFDDIDDDDKDDDASFQDPGVDDEDEAEEEDNWIVSDEEEEEAPKPKKKKTTKKSAPSVVVKPHKAPSASRTPANKGRRPSLTSMTAPSSSVSSTASSSMSTPSSRTGGSSSFVTPPLSTGGSPTAFNSSCTVATPLPYEQGAVNPAGSHVHHHLNFLRNPRDAQNRPPTHPDYDGRTLRLQPEEWKKHNNGKPMTDGTRQWWEIKAQYFDTVLLFKTGKFYEMFHMDADIGVQVCGTSCAVLLMIPPFLLSCYPKQHLTNRLPRLLFRNRLEIHEGSRGTCWLSRSRLRRECRQIGAGGLQGKKRQKLGSDRHGMRRSTHFLFFSLGVSR